MPAIDELATAYNAARDELHAAADALEAAPDDADTDAVDALQERFTAAETAAEGARETYDAARARADRLELARAQAPIPVVPDTPETSPSVEVRGDEAIYRPDRPEGSFFGDMYHAERGDRGAQARLDRHQAQMVDRFDLNSTDGTGGNYVPPVYLQDEFVLLARAGRPFANAVRSLSLPPRTDSINVPQMATGTAVAAQSDLGSVQETDATDALITVPVRTIAGQQDFSRQLFDRSTPGIDQIVGADLEAAYATGLDVQTLSGSGTAPNARGILNVSGIISVSFTSGSPTVPLLYPKLADAIQQIHTNRFLSPSAIVMHPRRWAWILAALDASNRPLVTPYAPQNSAALLERVGAENVVGGMHGLPVIVDSSIPTNLGAGTNEDRIIVTRLEDLYLFEDSSPYGATYYEVLSQNLAIRVQRWGYFAFTGERYPKATAVISGTGLVTPTF